ncbi:POPLD-domain-containing protein [Terfezia boudieri ATCC MYA-4762]|uniref:POPLD-domain-containing protein n=1 Tax=Terfezia boudieri ATCC MYA-4762 TaxID=1051890 RepID=A0A3N4LXG4_9PEZI|nr:POPLD-domain-containing protein [Terfezia boudieri ATCC MYA-4762]
MSPQNTPNPRKRGAPAKTTPGTSSQRQANNPVHGRKRLKIQDARAIAVQSIEAGLKGGQLNINSFVKSREFEIRALEDAISNSRHANKKRAFQSVPRSMRRRTASHNVKRVPKRLRARHAKEMADENTPTVTSRRRKLTPHMRLRFETAKRLHALSQKKAKRDEGREKGKSFHDEGPLENALSAPPATKTKFRKRQKEKTWLPTHVWHAKRAHMVNRWRYAITESPTEKSYRPTHRSCTLRGAVAWDHSYYGIILVKGKEKELAGMLQEILGTEDAELTAAKGAIRKGRRSWRGWVFEKGGYPTKPIAPILLLWCRPSIKTASEPEYEKKKSHRSILIRVHPSAFFQLWMTILLVSKSYPSITSEDLRFELGSLEVTGPAATNALLACLQPREKPASSDTPEGVWESLRSLTNPSSLPPGAFLAFNIMDPRIAFPPRLPRLSEQEHEESTNKLFSVLSTWPPDWTQSPPALFSREARLASAHAQDSQKKINQRKLEAMPGQLPEALSTDPYIPIILLINREPSVVPSHNKKFSVSTSNAIGSWTVILPWKWVLPVWYSLVNFPGVRFGGIRESNQIQYENAVGSFPDDFPGTRAGLEEEGRKAAVREQIWEKRPKQKRTTWESVDLGEGRKGELGQGAWCDWEHLIALVAKEQKTKVATKPVSTAPAQPHNPIFTFSGPTAGSMNLDDASIPPAGQIPPPIIPASITTFNSQDTATHFHSSSSPWTIPTSLMAPLLFSPHIPIQHPLSVLSQEILAKSLFSVKIVYLHRGTPEPRARIYRLPTKSHAGRDPLARKIREGWKDVLDSHEKYEDSKFRSRKKNALQDMNLAEVSAGQKSVPQKRMDPGASRCHRVALLPPLRAELPKPPLQPGMEGYPAVPGEEDLIGFVSSGNFNLKEGRGMGIASLAFSRVFGEWMADAGTGEQKGAVGRVCVVRDVGKSVGRLARWELI